MKWLRKNIALLSAIFGALVMMSSIGENLVAGVTMLQKIVAIYKIISGSAIQFVSPFFSAMGLPQPEREILDYVVLANISFSRNVWPLKEIKFSFRLAVVLLSSLSIFLIGYSVSFFQNGDLIFGRIMVFFSIYFTVGGFTILANQIFFSKDYWLNLNSSVLGSQKTFKYPIPGLLMRNLLVWPLMWFRHTKYSRKLMWAGLQNVIISVTVILTIGLIIRAIDDHADVTLPLVERWGQAIDQFIKAL